MTTFSLLCNMTIAVVAPFILSVVGSGDCSLAVILARVAPLLILPFAAAQGLPRPNTEGKRLGGRPQSDFVLPVARVADGHHRPHDDLHSGSSEADGAVETALAATALVICLVQFRFGRWLGRRYGDAVAGGQSLGQKNTVLAVWMAQSFLDPISSVAPTAYIVWQNFVNSYQLWRKESGGDRPADPNE